MVILDKWTFIITEVIGISMLIWFIAICAFKDVNKENNMSINREKKLDCCEKGKENTLFFEDENSQYPCGGERVTGFVIKVKSGYCDGTSWGNFEKINFCPFCGKKA